MAADLLPCWRRSRRAGPDHDLEIFDKNAYDDRIRDAIGKVIGGWGFRFPGIQDVEHVYFYAATSAAPELVKQYFQQAYELGRGFERPAAGAGHSTTAA